MNNPEDIPPFEARLGGQVVTVHSRRSLPDWDKVTPAEVLLAEETQSLGGRLLLLGCRHGALAAALARHCALNYYDETVAAQQMTARTLDANHCQGSPLDEYPPREAGEPYDSILIHLPKGRKLARRWLSAAHAALRLGGMLCLAGSNEDGVQAVLKDAAQLFGNLSILGYKKGSRIGRMLKNSQAPGAADWVTAPGIAPGVWLEFPIQLKGAGTLVLCSQAGVFSYDRLDEGTSFLLEHLEVPLQGRVLDFGCGCGVLGLAASRLGAASVVLVDNSLAAVAAAQETLRRNAIANAQVIASDGLEALRDWPAGSFDLILSNPPFHSGQAVDYHASETFLDEAWKLLAAGGRILLVANRFIRYEKRLAGRVSILAANHKYHLIQTCKE